MNVKHLLIIEDNPDDFVYVSELLKNDEKTDWNIYHAENLEKAKMAIQLTVFDAVLMDLGLPDGIGIKAVKKLLELDNHLPIIVFTGTINPDEGLSALKIGAQDFLSKENIDYELLIRTIDYAIERKKITDELDQQRKRSQLYMDIAEVMIIAVSTEGTIQLINKKACSVLECNEADAIGKNWFETFLTEKEKELSLQRSTQILIGNEKKLEYINSVQSLKGNKRLISWKTSPLFDNNSTIIGLLGSGQDITESRELQERIIKSEKNFRLAMQGSIDAQIVVDQNNIILFANNAAEKLFKKPVQSLINSEFSYPVPEYKTVEIEINYENSFRIAEMKASVIEWEDSPAYIISFRDVTDRKVYENEQDKLIDSLQEALKQVKTLKGLIPICCRCKKIRNDSGYWEQMEAYVSKHSEADFSHGFCPECAEAEMQKLKDNDAAEEEKRKNNAKILLVDDEEYIVNLLERSINKKFPELNVDVAFNGKDAINSFIQHQHDIIFMDIKMPILNGEEAYLEIMEFCEESDEEIPAFIFMTGYDVSESIKEIIDRNEKHSILHKPFGLSTIVSTLKDIL